MQAWHKPNTELYVHNVNTITYLAIPDIFQYCVLFIVFEVLHAPLMLLEMHAWLRHLEVFRKLQEYTTVLETLALHSYIFLKPSYAIIG